MENNYHYFNNIEVISILVDNLYMYHLDYEIEKIYSLNTINQQCVYRKLNLITRIGILLAKNQIIIPASNYFESDLSYQILNEIGGLSDTNFIKLASSSPNWQQFIDKVKIQHNADIHLPNYHYNDLLNPDLFSPPGSLIKRNRSASIDIKNSLLNSIDCSEVWQPFYEYSTYNNVSLFEKELAAVPSRLGERAYLSKNIIPLLRISNKYLSRADHHINLVITREYIRSFMSEYNASCLIDLPLIDTSLLFLVSDTDANPIKYIRYNYFATKLSLLKHERHSALDFIARANYYELMEFKESDPWKEIIHHYYLKNTSEPYEKAGKGKVILDQHDNDAKIGIVTALPKEYAAMRTLLLDRKDISFGTAAGDRYTIGHISSANNRTHKIALCLIPDMGNNIAAIISTKMQTHFPQIHSIIMTGIAGGVSCTNLGDIVVSNKGGVVQYDYIKETENNIEERYPPRAPSAQFIESTKFAQVEQLEGNNKWLEYIDQIIQSLSGEDFSRPDCSKDILHNSQGEPISRKVNEIPKVHFGLIASANSLQKNAKRRTILEKKQVMAIEMEASGIADSTWITGNGYLVIRGICDYCDQYKNDIWQNYAAAAAAAYTRYILELTNAD